MDYESRRITGRGIVGLIFVLIGGLYLLNNLGMITQPVIDTVISLPSAMIFLGAVFLLNGRKLIAGSLLLFFGVLLIIPRINPNLHYNNETVFALFLICMGLLILFRRRPHFRPDPHQKIDEVIDDIKNSEWARRKKQWNTSSDINDDRIDDVAIFGGSKRVLHSKNFQGGTITSIFGGSEIDLSECELAQGENYIDVLAIFGGTTILVPKDWKVIVNVFPLFGGFSIKGRKDPNIDYDPTKALIIKGTVIFGGGEVKINTYL